jgi:protein dithiol oxidoreductase (disulfide-forming)
MGRLANPLSVAKIVMLVTMICLSAFASAQSLYTEGQHYFRLKAPVAVQTGNKIEVMEVFSYACPHCGHFEPTIEKWRASKPANAQFVALPAMFNETWVAYARAYYASVDLKISHKTHGALFKALYEQNKQFTSLEDMAKWYAQYGVTEKQFTDAFTAKGMDARLKAANDATQKYEVTGTPTIIVDGKYRFDVTSAGGLDKVSGLINFLISKAAAERAANKKAS